MTGLEQRVYDVFSQNDLFVTLDSAMQYFTGMSRTQVENALESLCQQGKLYSTDTFVGKMYGYDSTEYCLADNALDVNISTGEGMESVIEALQNNDAVMIRVNNTGADVDVTENSGNMQGLASALSSIATKKSEKMADNEVKTGTIYDWTFNSGLRAGGNTWDVSIPDGFVKIKSSTRGFELVPKGMEYKNSDDVPIEILPTANVSGQDDSGLSLDNWFYHPLANKARGLLVSAIASKPQKINLNLSINGGEKRNISNFDTGIIPTKEVFGIASKELVIGVVVQDIMGTNNFLINFYSDTQHKQIRVRTGKISDINYKKVKQSIIRWADTFRFSKPNQKIPSLLVEDPICLEELKQGNLKTTIKAFDIIARDVAAPGNAIGDVGSILMNVLGAEKTELIVREQMKDAMTVREFYIPKVEKLFSQVRDILSAEKMLKLHEEYYGLSLTYLEAEIEDKHIRANLSPEAKKIVDKWAKEIKELEKPALYAEADKLSKKKSASDLRKAAQIFKDLKNYNDSAKRSKECTELADQLDKQEKYDSYTRSLIGCRNKTKLQELITGFRSLKGYKDSDEKIKYCEQLIRDIDNETDYSKARKLIADETDRKKLEEANNIFTRLYNYKDSAELAKKTRQLISDVPKAVKYKKANDDLAVAKNEKDKELAMLRFKSLNGYKDSVKKAESIASELEKARIRKMEKAYNDGVLAFNRKNYDMALGYFNSCIDWKDSKEYIEKCQSANKKGRTRFIIFFIFAVALAVGGYYFYKNIYPEIKYEKALETFSILDDKLTGYNLLEPAIASEEILVDCETLLGLSRYEESANLLKNYFIKCMDIFTLPYIDSKSTMDIDAANAGFEKVVALLINSEQTNLVTEMTEYCFDRWADTLSRYYKKGNNNAQQVTAEIKRFYTNLKDVDQSSMAVQWSNMWMNLIFENPDHIAEFVETVTLSEGEYQSHYNNVVDNLKKVAEKCEKYEDLVSDVSLVESWCDILDLIPSYAMDYKFAPLSNLLGSFTLTPDRGLTHLKSGLNNIAASDYYMEEIQEFDFLKRILYETDIGKESILVGEWFARYSGTSIIAHYDLEVLPNGRFKHNLPISINKYKEFYPAYFRNNILAYYNNDGSEHSKIMKIDIIDRDTITVYCYADGNTYTFHRSYNN